LNLKKVLISSVLLWLTTTILVMLTCGWLFNWVYLLPPQIWKNPQDMTNGLNLIGSNLTGFLRALTFVLVYDWLFKGLPGQGLKKGLNYGLIIWLVGALFGMASMPFYMTINPAVIVYWIVQALGLNLVNGAIVGLVYKDK